MEYVYFPIIVIALMLTGLWVIFRQSPVTMLEAAAWLAASVEADKARARVFEERRKAHRLALGVVVVPDENTLTVDKPFPKPRNQEPFIITSPGSLSGRILRFVGR